MSRQDVYDLINHERDHQQAQWTEPHLWGEGDCSSTKVDNTIKLAVLTEEVGEVARALLDRTNLKTELVQVAAVAVAWLETEHSLH